MTTYSICNMANWLYIQSEYTTSIIDINNRILNIFFKHQKKKDFYEL